MRSVNIVLQRSALIYDVENYSFIEGDIMATDNEHAKHQAFDIAQKGNIDRVTRMLNLAYSECVEMLYPYTKEIVEGKWGLCHNIIVSPQGIAYPPEEYNIRLTLPNSFSTTTINLLANLIQEYLVCKVLSDWMSIVNPGSQSNWDNKLNEIKLKISTSLVSRTGKLKRKTNPF